MASGGLTVAMKEMYRSERNLGYAENKPWHGASEVIRSDIPLEAG